MSADNRKFQWRIRWLSSGFWAIADQGLFATSNFILNVLLARWLSPDHYGAFTVAYVVFWIFFTIHTALLTEPMMIFGSGRYADRLSRYLSMILYGHLAFSILSSLLLVVVALGIALWGPAPLSSAFLGLALAGPLILLQGLLRRICYVHLKPQLAVLGGLLYACLMLAGVYIMHWLDLLSGSTAFILMGFASLASGLLLMVLLRVGLSVLPSTTAAREILRIHWVYGRWSTLGNVMMYVRDYPYYLLLPVWGGLEASAALRALLNPIMPMAHAMTAISLVLLPMLVRSRGHAEFRHLTRFALVLFSLGAGLYWILLGLFGRPLIDWLYAGQYSEHANLIWIAGILPLLWAVESVLIVTLRALERPNQIFWAQAPAAVVTLTVGVVLMIVWGLAGALVGLVVSVGAVTSILVYLSASHKIGTDQDT